MSNKSESLWQNLRILPRGAWILFFGTFLNKFGTFVLPFLAIYMTSLGYTTRQAGMAIAAYGVGTFCAALLGGYFADLIGRRKTIILSMFSVAFAMLALSQARSLPFIALFSALAGLTGELYRPASSALLADLVPAGQRVVAFAAYRMALNAGFAFGPATAGLLAKKSFTWLFIGDAASSVLFGLVACFALPAGLKLAKAENSLTGTIRILKSDARLRRILLACLLIGIIFVQIFSTMSLYIKDSGYSPIVYGLMISLNGALVVLCELPVAGFTRRLPARPVMAVGFLLIGAGFASNLIPRTLPLLAFTTVLFTLGEMIAMPVSAAYVADLAPPDKRGLYMGCFGLVWATAFIIGPSIGMSVYSTSPVILWSACGVLGVLAAWIVRGGSTPAPVHRQTGEAAVDTAIPPMFARTLAPAKD